MKKNLFVLAMLVTATITLFTGCDDKTTDPVTPAAKVGFYLNSTPPGAKVIINGIATTYYTPVTVDTLKASTAYSIALVLANYDTLKFTQTTTTKIDTVNKMLKPGLISFGPIRIWETVGTTSSQPSGLSLKYGKALSVAAANKDTVDLYYSSTAPYAYKLTSASSYSGLTRISAFKTGASSNLLDGVSSPVKDASWFANVGDRETNYVFVYDADGYYSKVKITSFGGGTPGNPAYVELQWLYNKVKYSTQF